MEDDGRSTEPALMRLVLELSMVIELTSDELLDPDTAVQWQEDIGATVSDLPLDARQRFAEVARELADLARASGRHDEAAFYDNVPDDFGLFDDEGESAEFE
jgi:hypothetical protein